MLRTSQMPPGSCWWKMNCDAARAGVDVGRLGQGGIDGRDWQSLAACERVLCLDSRGGACAEGCGAGLGESDSARTSFGEGGSRVAGAPVGSQRLFHVTTVDSLG
mmetsp:Transcript_5945/g.14438  ORF Transcript_5945/g.14438 Transcript_5945/m.14438 type:complete len:105 (-) Transcript_5945:3-317(-)